MTYPIAPYFDEDGVFKTEQNEDSDDNSDDDVHRDEIHRDDVSIPEPGTNLNDMNIAMMTLVEFCNVNQNTDPTIASKCRAIASGMMGKISYNTKLDELSRTFTHEIEALTNEFTNDGVKLMSDYELKNECLEYDYEATVDAHEKEYSEDKTRGQVGPTKEGL